MNKLLPPSPTTTAAHDQILASLPTLLVMKTIPSTSVPGCPALDSRNDVPGKAIGLNGLCDVL
jgi:hypothetical protein